MTYLLLLLFQISVWPPDQDAHEILKAHFDDYGQDQWNEIRTVIVEGRWIDSDYNGFPMKLSFKQPDKIKIQGDVRQERYQKAFDGTSTWIRQTWEESGKPRLAGSLEEAMLIHSFCLGSPLYALRDHLEFKGLIDMDGELYHGFQYQVGTHERTFYLGRDDHRLYFEVIEGGSIYPKVELTKGVDKYKKVNGFLMPVNVWFNAEGVDEELAFDDVYIDMGVDSSIFEFPKSQ